MRNRWRIFALLPALVLLAHWQGGSSALAQQGCTSCQPCLPVPPTHHCPKPFCHIQEGPPRIHFKHGCPRPVCNPCDLPHFGYFQPCWRPSPFAEDWSHCPEPPPAALVVPGPLPPASGQVPPGYQGQPTPSPNGAEKLPPPAPAKLSFQPPAR